MPVNVNAGVNVNVDIGIDLPANRRRPNARACESLLSVFAVSACIGRFFFLRPVDQSVSSTEPDEIVVV